MKGEKHTNTHTRNECNMTRQDTDLTADKMLFCTVETAVNTNIIL